jgi:hypothetical protein
MHRNCLVTRRPVPKRPKTTLDLAFLLSYGASLVIRQQFLFVLIVTMLDEYRQRFRAFHTHWQREQFLSLAGRKEQADINYLYRENSDLFTATALAELRAKYDDTAAYRETERAAIQRLIAFASAGQLTLNTLEVTREITDFETQATFRWGDQRLTIQQAQRFIEQESSPHQRRELHARRADLRNEIQDLRTARLAKLQAGAQSLGFSNLLQMQQTLHMIEVEKLVAPATQLLTSTESAFTTQLRPLLAREAHVSLDEASSADLGYARRLGRFTPYFSGERWRDIYADLFAGLGFKVTQQPQVEVSAASRSFNQDGAFCAPLQIPAEVKLVVNPDVAASHGLVFYQGLLHAAGQTQLYAWTSSEGHFEFRVPGDAAISEAWGTLFGQLLQDAAYLVGTFAFPESREFRHALAVFRLLRVRRAAALLQYETELYAGQLGAQAGQRFAELLTDGTRLRYDETEHLYAVERSFHSAVQLRAWAFEAQLREYLKMRFGTRWWTARKAGELLIDLWNTGHRYSVEELAAQVGLGALDFEWLTTELLEAVAV